MYLIENQSMKRPKMTSLKQFRKTTNGIIYRENGEPGNTDKRHQQTATTANQALNLGLIYYNAGALNVLTGVNLHRNLKQ